MNFLEEKEQYQERFQLATDRIRQIREECNSSSKESFNDPAITEKTAPAIATLLCNTAIVYLLFF